LINIQVLVKGEPDVPPFTKLFEFSNNDEPIFLNVIEQLKDKLSKNLKLNVHESLLIYCAYLVSEIRSNSSELYITKNSSKVLKQNDVLIGVPETLREMIFNISIDNLPKKTIRFIEPIPIANHIMDSCGPIGSINSETNSMKNLSKIIG
jgi:urease gamma subunit